MSSIPPRDSNQVDSGQTYPNQLVASQSEVNPFQAPSIEFKPRRKASVSSVPLEKYKVVRIGLQMVYYGLGTCVMAFFILIGGGVLTANAGAAGLALLIPGGIAILIGALAAFVGTCLCIAAPHPNERIKSALAVGLQVGSTLIGFVLGLAMGAAQEVGGMGAAEVGIIGTVVNLITQIMGIAATFFFIAFCQQVGKNTGSRKMVAASKSARNWFIALVVAVFVFVALAIIAGIIGREGMFLMIGGGVVLFVLAIGNLAKHFAMYKSGIDALKI